MCTRCKYPCVYKYIRRCSCAAPITFLICTYLTRAYFLRGSKKRNPIRICVCDKTLQLYYYVYNIIYPPAGDRKAYNAARAHIKSYTHIIYSPRFPSWQYIRRVVYIIEISSPGGTAAGTRETLDLREHTHTHAWASMILWCITVLVFRNRPFVISVETFSRDKCCNS